MGLEPSVYDDCDHEFDMDMQGSDDFDDEVSSDEDSGE